MSSRTRGPRGSNANTGMIGRQVESLVSIVIPVKNRPELVCQTLASVRAQTYPRWEAVVVDDGSTDGTVDAVREVAAADERVRLVIRPDDGRSGASRCRNLGFEQSRGEYVIFLDSDDLLEETCLATRVAAMEANPQLDFAVFQAEHFQNAPGDTGTYWSAFSDENVLDRYLQKHAMWATPSLMWRREAIRKIGGWDEESLSWQDWEFHIRAVAAGLVYQQYTKRDVFVRENTPGSIMSGNMTVERNVSICQTAIRLREYLWETGQLSEGRENCLRSVIYQRLSKMSRDWRFLPPILRVIRQMRRAGMLGLFRSCEATAFYTAQTLAQWSITRYRRRRFSEECIGHAGCGEHHAKLPWIGKHDSVASAGLSELDKAIVNHSPVAFESAASADTPAAAPAIPGAGATACPSPGAGGDRAC